MLIILKFCCILFFILIIQSINADIKKNFNRSLFYSETRWNSVNNLRHNLFRSLCSSPFASLPIKSHIMRFVFRGNIHRSRFIKIRIHTKFFVVHCRLFDLFRENDCHICFLWADLHCYEFAMCYGRVRCTIFASDRIAESSCDKNFRRNCAKSWNFSIFAVCIAV